MLFNARLAESRSKIAAGKRCRVRPVKPRYRFRPDLENLENRVTPSLIVNGDFETGDFSGWTQSGDLTGTFVASGTATAHGGKYSAALGPVSAEGFLAQTFTSTPGNSYTLNYWLENDGGTPNSFHAMIDGVDLTGSTFTDAAAFPFTQYTFTFTAANPSTELKFGFTQVPTFLHLDDVSIDAGTFVVPTVVRTNVTGTFIAPVSTDHLVFNTPIDPATFTLSTTNDQYAITDPSSNTINATTITATDATNTQFDVAFPSQTTNGAYTLTVGPSIADPAGNPMAAAFTSTFSINIPGSIVNGGFETGDFTGWTQSGVLSFTRVNTNLPHSGSYAAELGPDTGEGFLAQTLALTPGSNYTLDYWLQNNGGTPNSFRAMIDGVDIPLSVLTDAPAMPYTEFMFTFTAGGPTTEVKFGFLQTPSYWHLDDVSVVPAPAPPPQGGSGSQGTLGGVNLSPVNALPALANVGGMTGWGLSQGSPVVMPAPSQAEHARLVDDIFAGLGTKDGLATLPSQPLVSAAEADPFSLWLL
jgi:hypothetical protein